MAALSELISAKKAMEGDSSGLALQFQLASQPSQQSRLAQSLVEATSDIPQNTFGGGFLKGVASGNSIATQAKEGKKQDDLTRYMMAQLEHQKAANSAMDAQIQEIANMKAAMESRAMVQEGLDIAVDFAERTGDVTQVNEILNSEAAGPLKKLLERQVNDQGGVFQGVQRTTNGDFLPYGVTADGSPVYGTALPAEKVYSAEYLANKKAQELDTVIKQQQVDAFPAQQDLRESQAEQARSEAGLFDLQRKKLEAEVKKAEAEAARVGQEYSQDEKTSGGFAVRVEEAGNTLEDVVKAGNMPGLSAKILNEFQLGNFALTPEQQKFFQATRDFVNATLRKESGAVISEEEFANARRQYIPQPGDSQEVLEQKRNNRSNIFVTFREGSNGFYSRVKGAKTTEAQVIEYDANGNRIK